MNTQRTHCLNVVGGCLTPFRQLSQRDLFQLNKCLLKDSETHFLFKKSFLNNKCQSIQLNLYDLTEETNRNTSDGKQVFPSSFSVRIEQDLSY